MLTVEGLGEPDELHPLQQAFRETPRVPVRLLHAGLRHGHRSRCSRENPSPDEAEVREVLSGNICRCTGYQTIVEGVLLAAERGAGQAGVTTTPA